MKARMIKTAGLVILAAALLAPIASAMRIDEPGSPSVTPTTVVTPNDRAGTQGVGQTAGDPIGIGGQYGLNLIHDAQASSGGSVRPDDRAGARPSVPTAVVAPVSSTGNDINWGTVGIGMAGFAALALAIVLLTALGRRGRHEDLAVS